MDPRETSQREPPREPGEGRRRTSGDFVESPEDSIPREILEKRICDFGLKIEGRPLERVIQTFQKELDQRGISRVKPRFYLTNEWGVPDGTVAIGIPFYLADEQLTKVQELKGGMVEGRTAEDILQYLRHEMGHVVNYAYRLYATEEWTLLFGPMSRPYSELYRTVPFSPDYVRYLPGGYAQKHPDEDWAETFAVWMTAGLDWRTLYGDSPGALKKLEYCERVMERLRDRDPDVTDTEIDTDVQEIDLTLQQYYEQGLEVAETKIPRSLDGDLRGIFVFPGAKEGAKHGSGALLLRRNQGLLGATVYRWTGVDPAVTQQVLAHLIPRAEEMKLTYPLAERDTVLMHVTAFLVTLAMNYTYKGQFVAT